MAYAMSRSEIATILFIFLIMIVKTYGKIIYIYETNCKFPGSINTCKKFKLMERNNSTPARVYFIAMAAFWLIFGLVTTFYPALMDMFETETGISAVTEYSNHIWRHDGFDILSISVLLFALSREHASRTLLTAAASVALL